MIKASCHCGNVQIEIHAKTDTLTSCNCSICHRIGARWAYFNPKDIRISHQSVPTNEYQWGEKMINFHHCPQCGGTTHYTPVDKNSTRMAINFRHVAKELTQGLAIKYFDGADTWKFVEEPF
ncbi:GFA family protein [Litorilituus lipolyticus]|uniref:Aldehyde-activating protein n=1 Tax=Litorilituus lipolyticus TaxID=2491017 RepID=A0A502L0R1_9GAMM|nr:aldehyde-activating protein [Litorilituus lipolyticus]TPH17296.1 aldehyde-activating protein [Litorilituus lipolyticus]